LSALERLAIDFRYVTELAGYLRHTMTLAEARASIEQHLAARDESFLDILDRAVYARPESPYYKLLAHAGAELGDLRRQVRQDGLEATLDKLYDAGVYVSSEEMKGRRPIQRNGLDIAVTAADFDNPLDGRPHLIGSSSGSTGQVITFRTSLQSIEAAAVDTLISTVMQFGDRPLGYWSTGGVLSLLWYLKIGCPPKKLYFTHKQPWTSAGIRQKALLNYTRFISGVFGQHVVSPEFAARDEAIKIARWMAEMTANGTPAVMLAHANPAVRICNAARENGLALSGSLFFVYGEPFTSPKAAALASVGAEARVSYPMSEVGGIIGVTCEHATALDDVHFFTHRLAVIQRQREVAPGEAVGALVYTTVHPANPKLMLNADSGDYAVMSNRACDCLMGQMGLNTHLSSIRSYEKLTSEGTTFIGSRLYELVEEILPARFGGGINDYQLLEEEQESGLSQVSILVSPRVGEVDEAAVVATVLETLESSHEGGGGETMAKMWRQAGTLRVVRREPFETRSSKVMPLFRK
jgi:phenylacetate-coenzyme A ligase PaaK-like adenylate-forming protein